MNGAESTLSTELNMKTDDELFNAYFQCDGEALGEIYKRYFVHFLGRAYNVFKDKPKVKNPTQDAEDAIQNVFKRFLEKKKKEKDALLIKPEKRLAYFFQCIYYESLGLLRIKKRLINFTKDYDGVKIDAVFEDSLNNLGKEEFEKMFSEIVMKINLGSKEEEIFLLRLKGLSDKEIGEKLKRSPNGIRANFHNAKKKLHKNKDTIIRIIHSYVE